VGLGGKEGDRGKEEGKENEKEKGGGVREGLEK
jgi:hypothetical protein